MSIEARIKALRDQANASGKELIVAMHEHILMLERECIRIDCERRIAVDNWMRECISHLDTLREVRDVLEGAAS